ncbi:MAG: glycine zipper 2TM domain-containing protein [Sphingorhabdus sp.]|uniref:glycine zipper 2TM domain-containing protein n=1 Tax=Sphingorhabdus sp. TaxID=1902408 RepID=UPI003CBC0555
MRKLIATAAAFALALPGVALADPPRHAPAHGYYKKKQRNAEPIYRDTRVWRGDDDRYYCRRSDGTTGMIIGAAGGALIGRAIDTRGDRALGTILGAAGGAILGRKIDRDRYRCR